MLIDNHRKTNSRTNEKDRKDFYQYMKIFFKDGKYKFVKKEINKEWGNVKENESSNDTHTVTFSLDLYNPSKLTLAQKAELDALSDLPDDAVRKEAETDPDCEPLE